MIRPRPLLADDAGPITIGAIEILSGSNAKYAATLAVMLVAAALKEWLGQAGILIGAAVAGFADAHSAAISVASRLRQDGAARRDVADHARLDGQQAPKIGLAAASGPPAFALRIAPGLAFAIAAAWAGLLFFR